MPGKDFTTSLNEELTAERIRGGCGEIIQFDWRTSRARGLLFYRLMEQAVDSSPVTRQMIIVGRPQHSRAG